MKHTLRRATVAAWVVVGLALFGFGCGQLRSHEVIFGTPLGSLIFSADDTGYAVTLLDASDPPLQYKYGPNRQGKWDDLATWQGYGIDVLNQPWVRRLGLRHTLVLSLAVTLLLALLTIRRRGGRRSVVRQDF